MERRRDQFKVAVASPMNSEHVSCIFLSECELYVFKETPFDFQFQLGQLYVKNLRQIKHE